MGSVERGLEAFTSVFSAAIEETMAKVGSPGRKSTEVFRGTDFMTKAVVKAVEELSSITVDSSTMWAYLRRS
jgi:hypothetical protein